MLAECVNGANAAGCEIDTDDITYTLTGNIAPAADNVGITFEGFPAFANDNTVTQTGNITTTGDATHGVLLNGVDGNNIHIVGDISVNGRQAYGVYNFFGDFNRYIVTGGDGLTGNQVTIDGNILSEGRFGTGVFLLMAGTEPGNSSFIINGNTLATGTGGSGMTVNGHGFTVTQNGNITVTGEDSFALYSYGTMAGGIGSTMNVNGNITATNNGGTGAIIYNTNHLTINVVGDINTQGEKNGVFEAAGIFFQDAGVGNENNNNTINLTGNITTSGSDAAGLHMARGNLNTVNITGNVSTIGVNAPGIHLNTISSSNTFTINGNIITSGTDGDSEPILLRTLTPIPLPYQELCIHWVVIKPLQWMRLHKTIPSPLNGERALLGD